MPDTKRYDLKNPPAFLSHLPNRKQRQFIHVYDWCWDRRHNQVVCHAMAWRVVRRTASRFGFIAFKIAMDFCNSMGK